MLKVAVIGLGSISQFHIENYAKNEQVELIALCDQNEKRLHMVADQYGVTYRYQDVDELLKNEAIDAVSICTWNNFHAPIAIAALEAQKHVFIEKPLSLTVAEALDIEQAVEKSGKLLQVGYVRRFATSTKLAKEMIEQGKLGNLYYGKATCLRRAGNPGGWFADKNRSGGGPLIDLGVHMIDLLWYLMGKPKPVTVSGNSYRQLGDRHHIKYLSTYRAVDARVEENTVEDMANVLIRFDNGASIFVDVSFTLHAKADEIRADLYGDKGGVSLEPSFSVVTEEADTILNITPQIDQVLFDFLDAFERQINHFVQSCLGHEQPISPVSDGVIMMKMLEAVYESAALGKEIKL